MKIREIKFLAHPSAYLAYGVLIGLMVLLALVVPAPASTLHSLHVTSTQYHILLFTIVMPYALIWFAAFFAYARLDAYARRLADTPEGPGFRQLARGVGLMALGLAVPTVIGMILSAIASVHSGFRDTDIVINHYVSLVFPVVAFTYIVFGARHLTQLVKARPPQLGIQILIVLFAAIGVYYCYYTLHVWFRHDNPYHLPLHLMIFTVVIPYLYTWSSGLLGAYQLSLYAQKIKGLFYRQAIKWLAAGITIAIASSVMVQFITSIYAYRTDISLGSLLVVIYVLLLVEMAGYVTVAVGANRLKRIEEI